MSDYEELRRANIARNQAMLQELGLVASADNDLQAPSGLILLFIAYFP